MVLKNFKLVSILIALMVAFSSFNVNSASANTDSFVSEENGSDYTISTVEKNDSFIITLESEEGAVTINRDKNDYENVSITSDYLNEHEMNAFEEEFFTVYDSIQLTSEGNTIANLKEATAPSLNNDITPLAVVGSYAWSTYQNVTITFEAKATATVIAAAIASRIPLIGWIAGALASIIIINNMTVGYFKYRIGTALDSDPNYYWTKRQVLMYKDSGRTVLLSNEISNGVKSPVPTS